MGLSSSQARLLTLTARMHQIEYKAAKLEAQKLQMANESRQVYEEYLNALDMTKVQMKTINNTGAISYIDATYNNLIAAGYKISFIGDFVQGANTRFLKPVSQITNPANIPSGYTAINSIEDLQNIDNNLSGNYILMTDLDLSDIDWSPIGSEETPFSGTLNGNGHVIKNLYSHQAMAGGLFYNLEQATITNLGLENVDIEAENAGGLSAINVCGQSGTVKNCYVEGKLYGYYAGGLFGYADHGVGGTIEDCYTNVDLTSSDISDYIIAINPDSEDRVINTYYINTGTGTNNHPLGEEISSDELSSKFINIDDECANSTEWLTNMINAGAIIISKPDSKGNFFETSVAIDTGLQEVPDETLLRKAEAKYEADMRKIDAKDRKYDMDLAAIDNERNAIKSEMEALKTVAKDNIERTFKLFS